MIGDWYKTLFDATGFLTRDHCGPWTESLKLVYIVSSAFIALAYLTTAVCLYLIGRKRGRELDYGWLFPCFAGVFATCGLTHVCDVVVFWWPGYRLFSLIMAATAVMSVATTLWIPWLTRIILKIPTRAQFLTVNHELECALALKEEASNEAKETIAALRRQVNHLERMRQIGLWVAEQESALRDLKTVLDSASGKGVPK